MSYELIINYPEVSNYIKSNPETTILNVGCGIPLEFFEIINQKIDIKELVGIDKLESEKGILDFFYKNDNRKYRLIRDCNNFEDCHRIWSKSRGDDTSKDQMLKTQYQSYRSRLKFHFGCNIETDDISFLPKFDIILVQFVLHFIPHHKKKQVLNKILSHLKHDGLISIRVNLNTNSMYKNSNHFEYKGNNTFKRINSNKIHYPYTLEEFNNIFSGIPKLTETPVFYEDQKKSIFRIWRRG